MVPYNFICKTEGCKKKGEVLGRMFFSKKDREKYPPKCDCCGEIMEETELPKAKGDKPWYVSSKRYTEKRGFPKGLSNEKVHPDEGLEQFERDKQSGDFFH